MGDDKILGALIIQAPAKNEIRVMLEKAGFKEIKIYSDLKPDAKADASCFTYIATR